MITRRCLAFQNFVVHAPGVSNFRAKTGLRLESDDAQIAFHTVRGDGDCAFARR